MTVKIVVVDKNDCVMSSDVYDFSHKQLCEHIGYEFEDEIKKLKNIGDHFVINGDLFSFTVRKIKSF